MNNEIIEKYKSYDWFHSIGSDQYNRKVVYVNYLNKNVLELTNNLDHNILVHFAGYNLASSDNYINKTNIALSEDKSTEYNSEEDIEDQLFELEMICGRDNLIDLFYECHDLENAVSDISKEYPAVRAAMEVLYDQYGFDVLFGFLDSEVD